MQLIRRRCEPFNSEHVTVARLVGKVGAGAYGEAVNQHRARAAHLHVTRNFRSGEMQLFSKEVGERRLWLDLLLVQVAVHPRAERDGVLSGVRHTLFSS